MTSEIQEYLLKFRDKIDCDEVRIKEVIKQCLINNPYIISVLNNKELEDAEAEPDEYFGINILPYYQITPTQTDVQNFVCYEINAQNLTRASQSYKIEQIIFTVLCKNNTIIENNTGISRHDLLAALILDQFNHTTFIGQRIECVSDIASVVDDYYACRTLTFKFEKNNNLAKTHDDLTKIINHEVQNLNG
jgi:hypothetical protein